VFHYTGPADELSPSIQLYNLLLRPSCMVVCLSVCTVQFRHQRLSHGPHSAAGISSAQVSNYTCIGCIHVLGGRHLPSESVVVRDKLVGM